MVDVVYLVMYSYYTLMVDKLEISTYYEATAIQTQPQSQKRVSESEERTVCLQSPQTQNSWHRYDKKQRQLKQEHRVGRVSPDIKLSNPDAPLLLKGTL